jgi:thioredoxin
MTDSELEALRAKRLDELRKSVASSRPKVLAAGEPIVLSDASFDAETRKDGLILVDFWAAWCGPCLQVAPILEQAARERAATLRLGKLNVDDNPRTAERFQVSSIPTMMLFKDGKLVDAFVGALPKPDLDAWLDQWT